MYYYYRIRNKLNNKLYIGITAYPENRKRCHFRLLEKNKHFNPKLQNAYNKDGKENFIFEIIENKNFDNIVEAYNYERNLIEKYQTVENGYNCNQGGQWTGPRGKFNKQQVFYIKAACYYNEGVTGVLGRYFDCADSTINNIRINRNYKPWCEEFNKLSEQEKGEIYSEFCTISDFEVLQLSKNAKGRKLSKEQVFIILYCDETRFTTFSKLRGWFGVKGDHRNNFQSIRKGNSYKEYYVEYKKLTEDEKKKLLCTYIAKYM